MVAGGLELMSSTTRLTPRHLVRDAAGDALQQFIGQARPIRRHRIQAFDDPDSDHPGVNCVRRRRPDRLHRQEHAKDCQTFQYQPD